MLRARMGPRPAAWVGGVVGWFVNQTYDQPFDTKQTQNTHFWGVFGGSCQKRQLFKKWGGFTPFR